MRSWALRRLDLLTVTFTLAAAAAQSGDWLDQPPKQWNRPSQSLPKAPPDPDRDEIDPVCKPYLSRQPDTPEGREVSRAGWLFVASFQDGRGATVVVGAGTLDGMCRPTEYQDFVFFNGKFAGTLSPALMDARSDGSSVKISFPGERKISADFNRYTREDPLCCPSRASEATYEIRGEVVTLIGVRTRQTPQ